MEKARERERYLNAKREMVIEAITPICDVCHIRDYDYIIDDNLEEWLMLDGTYICCTATSVEFIISDLYGYLFLKYWKRPLGKHQDDVFDQIKLFWKK